LYATSSTNISLLNYLRRIATVMGREKATPEELDALAKAKRLPEGRRTGKKTVVETSISTWRRPRKIKMQRWITM
jgi:hypothetical protein